MTSYTETDPTGNSAKLKTLVTNDFHNLGGNDQDTQLSEAEVDEYIANNGYLTSYTETDPTVVITTTNKIPKWDGNQLVDSV